MNDIQCLNYHQNSLNYNRFSISYGGELQDNLVKMGANDLFDPKRADLTGIMKVNKVSNRGTPLEHFVFKTRVDFQGMDGFPTNTTGA